jgi:hypothetical protein
MFWIEAIPAAVYLICATQIPESPRYLVIKDRDSDARARARQGARIGRGETKIREIHESLSSEHKPRLSDILGPALFKKIVWLGIGLSVFQQFVGINVVFYYSNLLWQAVGLDESKAFLNTAIGGGTNVLTTFIAIALVDKIGRKPLLIFGSLLMMVSLGAMAFIFQTSVDANGVLDLTGDNAGKGKTRPRRAQPLHRRVRRLLGPHRLGHAGRDVQQPDPRRGPRRRRLGAVGGQLPHQRDLPRHARHQPGLRLRLLRRERPAQPPVRDVPHPRDQGQGTRGDGRTRGLTPDRSAGPPMPVTQQAPAAPRPTRGGFFSPWPGQLVAESLRMGYH